MLFQVDTRSVGLCPCSRHMLTPLGADKFFLRSFRGREAISELFAFQLAVGGSDRRVFDGCALCCAIGAPEREELKPQGPRLKCRRPSRAKS